VKGKKKDKKEPLEARDETTENCYSVRQLVQGKTLRR
jgi:hypothetical protein